MSRGQFECINALSDRWQDLRFWRERTNKHATRILNLSHNLFRLLKVQNQVLRSIFIAKLDSLFQILDLNGDTLLDRLPRNLDAGERPGLSINFGFDSSEVLRGEINGEEDDLGVDAVFGLREEVGSNEDGVGSVVGDDLLHIA